MGRCFVFVRFLRSSRAFWLSFGVFTVFQVPWGLFLTYLMVAGSVVAAVGAERSLLSVFVFGGPRLILTALFVSSFLAGLRGRRIPAVSCLLGACALELVFAGFTMSGPVPPSVFFQLFVLFTVVLPLILCVGILVERLRKNGSDAKGLRTSPE